MNENDKDLSDFRIERSWISKGTASMVYGLAMAVLTLSAMAMVYGIGSRRSHGSGTAAGICVLFVLLPIAIIAMLFTLKMSRPRWTKALAAFVVWSVCFVAVQL